MTTHRELTAAIRQRYQTADRVGKKMILDEFAQVTGYHRKHAIRVLTTQPASEPKTRAARRVYQERSRKRWEAADRIHQLGCGQCLAVCHHDP